MKNRLPTRKEFVILLFPTILLGVFSLYQGYLQKNRNLLQGKWMIIDQSGYQAPGEVCFISFSEAGISEVECKGGMDNRASTDSVTQSKYKVGFGKIYFFDGKIISSSPSLDWRFGAPDITAHLKVENDDLISVKYPSIPLISPEENTTSGESTSKWRRIK